MTEAEGCFFDRGRGQDRGMNFEDDRGRGVAEGVFLAEAEGSVDHCIVYHTSHQNTYMYSLSRLPKCVPKCSNGSMPSIHYADTLLDIVTVSISILHTLKTQDIDRRMLLL